MRTIINHNEVATKILQENDLITFTDTQETYKYSEEKGIYEPAETWLNSLIQTELADDCKTHLVNEVKDAIKRQTYKDREETITEKELIPLNNTIYNFKTGETIPYSPEHIFLSKHPINYNPERLLENPIDTFLTQITANQEDQLLIKEMIGYCYYRGMPFQYLFILYGSGGNGKSVILEVIRKMLGEKNVSGQSLQNLANNRFAASMLYNKNANIFGDLPKSALRDVGVLKELTGGDLFTAEQKFKNGFQFYNHAKIIASCNEVPETPDDSDGWYRRIIIINFPNYFGNNPNRQLAQELCIDVNLSDFFISCIDAFKQALEDNQFIRKETIEEQRKKYLHFSNSALSFIVDCLELDSEAQIESSFLYKKYRSYCLDRRIVALNEELFFKRLYKLYPNNLWRKRSRDGDVRVNYIVGLDFKQNYSDKFEFHTNLGQGGQGDLPF